MKSIGACLFIAGVVPWLHVTPLQAMDVGPETRAEAMSMDAMTSSTPLAQPMCSKGDDVVFSCPLGDGRKTASMCAASNTSTGYSRFYYAYGRPDQAELMYPASHHTARDAFTRTHLTPGPNAEGYAYAFVNDGYKYVVYTISGDPAKQDGGVIIQRTGERKVVAKLQCQPGRIIETDKDAVIDATLRWKHDSLIETEGLPAMR